MTPPASDSPLVWLLREPQTDDPFERCLRDAGFEVLSLPVLEFEPLNDEALLEALSHPERYGGLAVTSPRAAQLVADGLLRVDPEAADLWTRRPAYVVGPRTSEILEEAGFTPVGAESGDGHALGENIRESYRAELPLLFLAGDRRRDDLPGVLDDAAVDFEELTVYRTDVGQIAPQSAEPEWVVLFSPSAIEAVERSALKMNSVRFAAIGRTTAEALTERGLQVDAVAEEPSPDALCQAMLRVSGRG